MTRIPDRLQPLFSPDATFFDSVNGEFRGWPEIRDFYRRSLESWGRIDTVPSRSVRASGIDRSSTARAGTGAS